MIEVVGASENLESEVDKDAMNIFLETLNLLGGPRKLFEYRNLTWLPSLMEAAYVVVYSKKYMKTANEIASILGISTATVKNILNADESKIEEMLSHFEKKSEAKTHVAGALAKLAYKKVVEKGPVVERKDAALA